MTGRKSSRTSTLAKGVSQHVRLFCDLEGEPFAAIGGLAHPVDSKVMRAFVARYALEKSKLPISRHVIDEVIAFLGSIALTSPERLATHVRVAQDAEGALWLDLGRDSSPSFARLAADGWELRDSAPVMFRRPTGSLPLPIPERGGTLAELCELLAFEAQSDAWALCAAWLVGALQVGRPYAILAFSDQQGRGKTVRARMLRNLIDPNVCDVERPPRNTDDLLTAAENAHVLAFDNLSTLPEWLADDLCVVATGGGLRKRKLYSNRDVSIVRVMRPLIVTGISEIARSDLASRALRVELGPLRQRRTEAELLEAYDAARSRMLGAVLDAAVCALRRAPGLALGELPRLADFARWATAAEPALGLPEGAVIAAMQRAEAAGAAERVEGSPLQKLLDELTRDGPWKGSPSTAHERLGEIYAELRAFGRIGDWRFPASAHALSMQLRRAAPDLRRVGFLIDLDGREGRDRNASRVWSIDVETGTQGTDGNAAA